jgi:hypothetical protein
MIPKRGLTRPLGALGTLQHTRPTHHYTHTWGGQGVRGLGTPVREKTTPSPGPPGPVSPLGVTNMKRLFGTRTEEGGSEGVGWDKLAIALRTLTLVGACASCATVAILLHSRTHAEACVLSYSIAGLEIPHLEFNRPWECHLDYIASIIVACITGFFSMIGLRNLYQRNLKCVQHNRKIKKNRSLPPFARI